MSIKDHEYINKLLKPFFKIRQSKIALNQTLTLELGVTQVLTITQAYDFSGELRPESKGQKVHRYRSTCVRVCNCPPCWSISMNNNRFVNSALQLIMTNRQLFRKPFICMIFTGAVIWATCEEVQISL